MGEAKRKKLLREQGLLPQPTPREVQPPKDLRVYHGTTESVAAQAVLQGLRPRPVDGPGTWPGLESNPDFVYMSRAWSLAFAVNAVEKEGSAGIRAAIIEIETNLLDEGMLHPDEDFLRDYRRILRQLASPKFRWEPGLARVLKMFPEIMPVKGATLADISEDIAAMQVHWRKSFHLIGTGAYKGSVPVNAITRYALVDQAQAPLLVRYSQLMPVRIMNFLPARDQHEALIALIFDGTPLPDVRPKVPLSPQEREIYNLTVWGSDELKAATEAEREVAVQVFEGPAHSSGNTEIAQILPSIPTDHLSSRAENSA